MPTSLRAAIAGPWPPSPEVRQDRVPEGGVVLGRCSRSNRSKHPCLEQEEHKGVGRRGIRTQRRRPPPASCSVEPQRCRRACMRFGRRRAVRRRTHSSIFCLARIQGRTNRPCYVKFAFFARSWRLSVFLTRAPEHKFCAISRAREVQHWQRGVPPPSPSF